MLDVQETCLSPLLGQSSESPETRVIIHTYSASAGLAYPVGVRLLRLTFVSRLLVCTVLLIERFF